MCEPSVAPAHATHPFPGELLARLSLQEKITLLTGADFWTLHAHAGIGLRPIRMSDGPAGVRGPRWDERDTALNVPAPVALAATWDPDRAELIGEILAAECRRKGIDILLAPTVNLQRSPLGGRDFEFLGEDPVLSAAIGAALVTGLQRQGVGATVKHFVANDAETQRFTVDNRVSERVLRELYLAPFESIVLRARPWAVMAAYNSVNGDTMTESPMLSDILKREWGFDGIVVSDWHATRTVSAAAAGLDLVMPGPSGPWGPALAAAVRDGLVSEAAIDDKVTRLLRLATRVGALAPEGFLDDGLARASAGIPRAWTDERAREALRSTAAAGFVLARNERSLLPLDREALRRVAVIGPNAATPRTLGGGSATVFPEYVVSPLDGLRAAFGPDVDVDYSPGVLSRSRIPLARLALLNLPGSPEPGALVEFVARDGSVLHAEHRGGAFYTWRTFPEGVRSAELAMIRVRTTVRAQEPGTYRIGCSGDGRFRLTLAGAVAFDRHLSLPDGTDPTAAYSRPPQHATAVRLSAGQAADVVLEYRPQGPRSQTSFDLGGVAFQFNIEEPHLPDEEEMTRAVVLAERADAAVVVIGSTEETESEGFDRASLDLPGRQNELVRRVAEANPRTVVVVNTGAPVLLPWADDVPAVLLTMFPGQEYGHGLADVILGRSEPGGRLPVTWPDSADNLPHTQPTAGALTYSEGLNIGYRHFDAKERRPLYPFGHGLGYTTWEYLRAEAIAPPNYSRSGPGGELLMVRVRVRNSGSRHGRETIQVYASRPDSAVERPVRWLAGFASIEADPDAEATADIPVPLRRLAHWDTATGSWAIEPGEYWLSVGRSSRDLPIRVAVTVGLAAEQQSATC
ncbi:MAG: beta-glucosidase family protein [Trebonia sp.]